MNTLNPPRHQRGAALVVGLVLLMILTLLGVSGLNTATLELAMAGNTQQSQYAFQAAESALNAEIASSPARIALQGGEVRDFEIPALKDVPYAYDSDNGQRIANVAVTTTYQGTVSFGGASREVHFEANGVATTAARGAQSTQRVGFFFLAPDPTGR